MKNFLFKMFVKPIKKIKMAIFETFYPVTKIENVIQLKENLEAIRNNIEVLKSYVDSQDEILKQDINNNTNKITETVNLLNDTISKLDETKDKIVEVNGRVDINKTEIEKVNKRVDTYNLTLQHVTLPGINQNKTDIVKVKKDINDIVVEISSINSIINDLTTKVTQTLSAINTHINNYDQYCREVDTRFNTIENFVGINKSIGELINESVFRVFEFEQLNAPVSSMYVSNVLTNNNNKIKGYIREDFESQHEFYVSDNVDPGVIKLTKDTCDNIIVSRVINGETHYYRLLWDSTNSRVMMDELYASNFNVMINNIMSKTEYINRWPNFNRYKNGASLNGGVLTYTMNSAPSYNFI